MSCDNQKDIHSWFQVVEIEVSSKCNRRCKYCPQTYKWFRKPEHLMDKALFKHIISQLTELAFAGRLSFHMYNEPLLHPGLEELVAHARSMLPLAWLVIYTNGDLLTDERYNSLLNAGIDRFLVTRHNPGFFARRTFQEIRYAGEFMLSNRAGLINHSDSIRLPCFAPCEMMMIHHDGSVVLCHEDAACQAVMGSADRQTLCEIWFSESFKRYRSILTRGDRNKAGELCAICDNRLHPLPDTAI